MAATQTPADAEATSTAAPAASHASERDDHSRATRSSASNHHADDEAPAWWSTGGSNSAGAAHAMPEPHTATRSRKKTAPIVAGVAALALLAGGGYFIFGHGKGDTANASVAQGSTTPSATPSSGSMSPTSDASPSSTGTHREEPSPQTTVTVTQAATEPTTSSDSGSSDGSNSSGSPFNQLDAVTTSGSYAATASGNDVTIYENQNGNAMPVSTITVAGTPTGHSFTLVSLPGCQKPVLAYNAEGSHGSAAYSWNGSAYRGLKSDGGDNLVPTEPIDGSYDPSTYRITTEPGLVSYQDSSSSGIHNFRSCDSSQGDDQLIWDK